MRKIKFIQRATPAFTIFCAFTIFIFCGNLAFAKTLPQSPHNQSSENSGIIAGTLYTADGKPLGDQMVTLGVFNKTELILTVPKKTGPDGSYRFKNIFRSPDFSYAIDTEYNGNVYQTNSVSLGQKESIQKLDLKIGPESLVGSTDNTPPQTSEGAACKREGPLINEYQALAIILSIGAIAYAVFRKKKISK